MPDEQKKHQPALPENDALDSAADLDQDLLEMEILYRTRCVAMPPFPAVTVRDTDDTPPRS